MKLRLVLGGIALLAMGATASFADTPAPTGTPATQPAPATQGTPADQQAQGTQPTPPADGQPAQPDPNEKICKKDETTGSRIGKVCQTRKEWDDEKKNGGSDF